MTFDDALDLFKRTLATERSRPDVHAAMSALALPDTIGTESTQVQQALAHGERVWMTADLHLCHANVIRYCNRPFTDVAQMNAHLVSQTQKIRNDEWLVIVGDLAMGDHQLAMEWIRRIPGRKVLVLGNHDLTRSGECRYLAERSLDGPRPLFDAVLPFLAWQDALGRAGAERLCEPLPGDGGAQRRPAPELPRASAPRGADPHRDHSLCKRGLGCHIRIGMSLNPKTVKRRSEPSGRTCIDSRYRFPLPPEMGWKVGDRVYFSRTDAGKAFKVSLKPGPLLNGRLISSRIQRVGFTPSAKVHKKPRRSRL